MSNYTNNRPSWEATKRRASLIHDRGFANIFQSWILIALGVIIAAHTSEYIHYENASALFLAVLILSFLNVVIKPVLVLFTLPFVVVTMGLGMWVINALLFMMVGNLVEGFFVDSFSAALWGALVLSLTSLVINNLFSGRIRVQSNQPQSKAPTQERDNSVIDI
tara:strand:+ start:17831 stop:18322 length:492 start_codon:yes stop_codon:yes gene_type:complete